jgi:hypothetical protein
MLKAILISAVTSAAVAALRAVVCILERRSWRSGEPDIRDCGDDPGERGTEDGEGGGDLLGDEEDGGWE